MEGAAPSGGTVKPLVVVGPSGVGKGTLISKLMAREAIGCTFLGTAAPTAGLPSQHSAEEFPTQFGFSVSHTTRGPRPGEVDKVHYHFTDKESILKEIGEGKFLEHAEVHGNVYGTSYAALDAVKAQGKICILDIDVQGAESCKRAKLDSVYVFISPPSLEELEKRLRGRGTETEEKITLRLANARKEYSKKDDPGFFDGIVVNDDLEAAYGRLKEFICKHIKPLVK